MSTGRFNVVRRSAPRQTPTAGSASATTPALPNQGRRRVVLLACDRRPGPPRRCMTPLKAFIVEDSPVIRENLVAALEEMAPIEVVGTADDEASALGWLSEAQNRCDLVV